MVRQKASAWLVIEQEFNRSSPGKIFWSHVGPKNKYKNLKKRTGHKIASEKVCIRDTGGGSYHPIELDEIDTSIRREILGEKRVAGRAWEFDDDGGETFMLDDIVAESLIDEEICDIYPGKIEFPIHVDR